VFTLDGKVAIVTGGASGIGAATAALLAKLGAAVVIADINQPGAEAHVKTIEADGGTALAIHTDVGDEDMVRALVAGTLEAYGRLDILHNNAAAIELVGEDFEITTQDLDVWERTLRTDLTGPMLGCKHGVPAMLKTGGGSIINTASVSGIGAEVYMTAYPVAKAGVIHLTREVALQWGKQGIRCNAIAPGLVLSPAGLGMPEPLRDLYIQENMTPYVGTPEDIAPLVAFLASDLSRYITGETIRIDGGVTNTIPIAGGYRAWAAQQESTDWGDN
jgi:NAD(P)-dependent dehydrogenase (short-subunit alcohol dehydrogenase family)